MWSLHILQAFLFLGGIKMVVKKITNKDINDVVNLISNALYVVSSAVVILFVINLFTDFRFLILNIGLFLYMIGLVFTFCGYELEPEEFSNSILVNVLFLLPSSLTVIVIYAVMFILSFILLLPLKITLGIFKKIIGGEKQ